MIISVNLSGEKRFSRKSIICSTNIALNNKWNLQGTTIKRLKGSHSVITEKVVILHSYFRE